MHIPQRLGGHFRIRFLSEIKFDQEILVELDFIVVGDRDVDRSVNIVVSPPIKSTCYRLKIRVDAI